MGKEPLAVCVGPMAIPNMLVKPHHLWYLVTVSNFINWAVMASDEKS